MKNKSPILVAILSLTLTQSVNALPQSQNTPAGQLAAQRAPGKAADEVRSGTNADQSSTLESMVPREGLQFYFEMGSAGLTAGGNSVVPLSKMLAAGPLKVTTGDLAAFVMSNAGALSNTKLVLAGYGTGGSVVIVEAANTADAEQLSAGVTRLLGSKRPTARATTSDVDVTVRGRMVVAGARATVARLAEPNGERTLANDLEFMKARSRFSKDPLFAFIDLGAGSFGMPSATSGALDAAYTAGSLAALSGIPYAIAVGGSLDGDAATMRALFINGSKQAPGFFGGLLSSITASAASSAGSTQSMAATFAPSNADIFVDLMIDWDKLLDAIQSMLGMFAGAVAAGAGDPQSNGGLQASGAQGADLLAMAEASLGFSIKQDLVPTLGNELAITLSGFNSVSMPTGASVRQPGNATAKRSSPRFLLVLAVRDEVKFEKLLVRLLNGPTGSAGQPLARTLYRGATINSRKDVAYAITGGFLLAGGRPR
jgi:hypothetical protein